MAANTMTDKKLSKSTINYPHLQYFGTSSWTPKAKSDRSPSPTHRGRSPLAEQRHLPDCPPWAYQPFGFRQWISRAHRFRHPIIWSVFPDFWLKSSNSQEDVRWCQGKTLSNTKFHKFWCLTENTLVVSAVKTLCVRCLSGLRNSSQTSVPIQLDYKPKSPWRHQSQNSVIIDIKNWLCSVILWAPHVGEVETEWQVQRDQHNRGAQVSKPDVPIQQHKLSLSVEADCGCLSWSACPLMGVRNPCLQLHLLRSRRLQSKAKVMKEKGVHPLLSLLRPAWSETLELKTGQLQKNMPRLCYKQHAWHILNKYNFPT